MKIAHLADIHIRNTSLYNEYKEVFETLYNTLKNDKPDIITVVGDVFHAKQVTSPESNDLAFQLLFNLSNIATTVVTIGNHDLSIQSKDSRIDALTPVVKQVTMAKPKYDIHYLKYSETLTIKNVDFYHYSFLDDVQPTIIENDNIKLGLFHGIVSGSKTYSGHEFSSEEEKRIIPYDKLDYVLLGDIHQFQKVKNNAYYPSSLICQDYGEHPDEHGYILWDFSKKDPINYVRVPNPYTYYTINVDDTYRLHTGNMGLYQMPKAKVRCFYHPVCDLNKVKEVVYSELPSTLSITFRKTKIEEEKVKETSIKESEIINLYSLETQIKYLREWFKDEPKEIVDKIIDLHHDLYNLNQSVMEFSGSKQNYSLKSLSFSNTLCYGENNTIDFTKLKGIVGLFARNRTGKSSLLNTIPFSIWGDFPRMGKLDNVFNNNENTYSVSNLLSCGEFDYITKRNGRRTKKTMTNTLEFIKIHPDGREENLTEDSNPTNATIRTTFGDLDTYLKTAYIYQNSNDLFLNMKPADRKDWFTKNLGAEVFDVLHESAKKMSQSTLQSINVMEKEDYLSQLNDINERIVEFKEKCTQVEQEYLQLVSEKNTQLEEIENLRGTKKIFEDVNDPTSDIETTELLINSYTDKIDKEKESKIDLSFTTEDRQTIKELEVKLTKVDEVVRKQNEEAIKEKTLELEQVKNNGLVISDEITKLEKKQSELSVIFVDFEKSYNDYITKLTAVKTNIAEVSNSMYTTKQNIELHKGNLELLSTDSRYTTEDLCKSCPLLKKSYDSKDKIEQYNKELIKLEKELLELKVQLDELENENDTWVERNKQFKEFQNIKHELDNKILKRDNTREKYKLLSSSLKVLQTGIDDKIKTEEEKINNLIDKLKTKIENDINAHDKKCTYQIELFEEKKRGFELRLLELKKQLKKFNDNKVLVEFNEQVDSKIQKLQQLLNDTTMLELDFKSKELIDAQTNLKVQEHKLQEIREKQNEYERLVNSYRAYGLYIKATHRDSIPLMIINQVLSKMEFYVNEVLDKVADFNLKLYIEDNKILASTYSDSRGEWTSDLLSGMETFVVNLAFRIGIQSIANLSIPNFLIIDEGFSAMDSEYSQNLPTVFDYLKSIYDFVIIVSHHDFMHDFVDYTIEITRENEKSYININ